MIRAALAVVALACADPTALVNPQPISAAGEISPAVSSTFSIDAARTMYVRLATPRAADTESPREFISRMFAAADAAGARRLVVDLRLIAGRDARLAVPLVRGVIVRDRFVRAGGLVVVTGERTFSPMQTTASLLERYAQPRFVSEYRGN